MDVDTVRNALSNTLNTLLSRIFHFEDRYPEPPHTVLATDRPAAGDVDRRVRDWAFLRSLLLGG
eukprot:767263-Hanusia_phi.AAC.16